MLTKHQIAFTLVFSPLNPLRGYLILISTQPIPHFSFLWVSVQRFGVGVAPALGMGRTDQSENYILSANNSQVGDVFS